MADNIFDGPAPAPPPAAPAAAQPPPAASGNIFDGGAPPAAPGGFLGARAAADAAAIPGGVHMAPPSALQKAAGTTLRRFGDVLEDFSFAPALGIGATHPGKESYQAMMGEAFARLAHGDFSGFSDVAGEYGFGSTPELQYESTHDPVGWQRNTADYLLHHPLANAAATFGVEWFNPINRVVPHVAGLAGDTVKAVGRGITKIPRVGPVIGDTFARHADAVQRYFNRWHGMYQQGEAPAVQAGMQIVSEKNAVPANARPIISRIFGYEGPRGAIDGLSRAQHYEIGRLSQGLARDAAVPEVAHGASLADRGVELRTLLKEVDAAQREVGLLPPERTFDSETYVPMQPELTYAEHAPEDTATARSPGGAGRVKTGTSAPGKSKTYLNLDQVRGGENPAQFADNFDLAENVRQHYVQRMQNVAIEQGIRRFAGVLNKEGQAMLRPLVYRLTRAGGVMQFGEGEQGYMRARLWAAAEAHRLSKLLAAEKAGLAVAPREMSTSQLFGKRAATSRFQWRMSKLAQSAMRAAGNTNKAAAEALGNQLGLGNAIEANRVAHEEPAAADVLARMSKRERARYENQRAQTLKTIRRPSVTHAADVGRQATDHIEQLDKIDAAISARQINNEQAQIVKLFAREMAKSIRRDLFEQIQNESRPTGGFKMALDERGVPLLNSPTLRKQTVDPELLRFLRDDLGAPSAPASMLGRYWTTLNALARVGIISNPIIHPTWNLAFQFLAAGGDLSFLNPLFRRSLFHATDPEWEARASKAGANYTLSQGTFGISNEHEATILSGSMHELGTLGKMDKVASAAWRANQKLVFDVLERRYATELFRTYVEKMGKTDAEAAIAVRKALGDYTNLTRNERWLNNLFFFYPWMKTVVPFWIKKSIEQPQWLNAPSRAAQTYNAQVGDPGTSNPFTFSLGKGAYYTPMLPQRVMSPFLQAVTPSQPGESELTSHIQPAADYLVGHLNPFVSSLVDLWSTMVQPAQDPGFYVIADKDAPAGTFWKQVGQGTLGQFVYPFREGRGIFEGLSRDDYKPLLGIVPGGFVTIEDPSALYKAESGIRRKYEGAIKAATDPLVKEALRVKLQQDLDTLQTRYGAATP